MGKLPANRATAAYDTEMKRIINNAPKPIPKDGQPSQSERFIAKARELGLNEREETFDAALTKVARHKPLELGEPVNASPPLKETTKGRKSI